MNFMSHPSTSATRREIVRTRALLAALGITVAGSATAAPIGGQAFGGWYTDPADFLLGVGARVGAAMVTVIPIFEWLFVDGGSAYSLNVDGTLDLLPLEVATVYAGGGIGWLTFDPDAGDSNTDTVLNLIAGASFNVTNLKPFAQLKWVVKDGDDRAVFSFGVRF